MPRHMNFLLACQVCDWFSTRTRVLAALVFQAAGSCHTFPLCAIKQCPGSWVPTQLLSTTHNGSFHSLLEPAATVLFPLTRFFGLRPTFEPWLGVCSRSREFVCLIYVFVFSVFCNTLQPGFQPISGFCLVRCSACASTTCLFCILHIYFSMILPLLRSTYASYQDMAQARFHCSFRVPVMDPAFSWISQVVLGDASVYVDALLL